MAFIKSKRTTYRNQPVGVVPVNTGAEQAAVQSAKLFEAGQKIAWEEAKADLELELNSKILPTSDDATPQVNSFSIRKPAF